MRSLTATGAFGTRATEARVGITGCAIKSRNGIKRNEICSLRQRNQWKFCMGK